MINHEHDEMEMQSYMASVLVSTQLTKDHCKKLQQEQGWLKWDREKWKEICCEKVKEILHWDVALTNDQKIVDFVLTFKMASPPTLYQTHCDLLRYWESKGINTQFCPRPQKVLSTQELAKMVQGQRSLSQNERERITQFMQRQKRKSI